MEYFLSSWLEREFPLNFLSFSSLRSFFSVIVDLGNSVASPTQAFSRLFAELEVKKFLFEELRSEKFYLLI